MIGQRRIRRGFLWAPGTDEAGRGAGGRRAAEYGTIARKIATEESASGRNGNWGGRTGLGLATAAHLANRRSWSHRL